MESREDFLGNFIRDTYLSFTSDSYVTAAVGISADFELTIVTTGEKYRGRVGYLEFMRMWAMAFPDDRIDVSNVIVGGETAAVEFTLRGTHKGPCRIGGRNIPATGRKIELQICDVLRLKADKIISIRTYFSLDSLWRQLGV